MENSLKQRIVGAVVLVALAVIFLPAILKEKRAEEPFESQIPDKPVELLNTSISEESKKRVANSQQKLDSLTKDSHSSSEEAGLSNNSDEKSDRKQKKEVAESQSNAAPSEKKNTAVAKNTGKTDEKSGLTSQSEANKLKAESPEKPKPETIGKEFKSAAWLIQVASFSSQENADRMVTRLKSAKHKAYSRKGKSQNRTIYRIYVGPFIEKSRAEKSLKQVNSVSETKGMLIPFDPIKH